MSGGSAALVRASRIDRQLAVGDALERRDHGIGGRVLQKVAGRPATDRLEDVATVVVERDHHDGDGNRSGLELVQAGEPVGPGHPDVEQDDVGMETVDGLDTGRATVRIPDDLDPLGGGEHRLEPATGHLVVVDQDDPPAMGHWATSRASPIGRRRT